MSSEILQVITTTAEESDANKLGRAALENRLAACMQIAGPVESSYWWNGRIETVREFVCVMKTTREAYPKLEQLLLSMHPYEEPEIVAVPAAAVSPGYQKWLVGQLKSK